jgi:hypothetical protein
MRKKSGSETGSASVGELLLRAIVVPLHLDLEDELLECELALYV